MGINISLAPNTLSNQLLK